MSRLREAYAAFLFVVTISLMIAASKGFYSLVVDTASNGKPSLGLASPAVALVKVSAPTPFESSLPKPVEVEHYSDEERRSRVLVTLTAYKLLASRGKLSGDLSIRVPSSLKAEFEPQLSQIVGCPESRAGLNTQPNVVEDYADKHLLISVLNEARPSDVQIPILLDDFLAYSIDPESETCQEKRGDIINRPTEFRVPTDLPVLAGPAEQYPSDYHQLAGTVQIRLPQGFALSGPTQDAASGMGSSPATLPLAMRFRTTRGMEGRTIAVFRPYPGLPLRGSIDRSRFAASNPQVDLPRPPPSDEVDLRLLIVRDWETQSFYYAVTLLPLALLVLVIVSLFSGAASSITEQTWNLAGFTIAISALRTILIPSDVQGLTRIDYMLVIQLLVITSLIAFLNGWHVLVSASRNNPVDEDKENTPS
jgi:hypothetical protein